MAGAHATICIASRPRQLTVMLNRGSFKPAAYSSDRKASDMAKTPQVGEQAPDFELLGTDGPFKLSDHRGERVVLLFYPGDNTPVCLKQMCSYRDRAEAFEGLDATIAALPSPAGQ